MTKNKKIGYTTGVFDMFHIGHLNLLKLAKERCDYLIVGVSTDELVEEYKKKKPIIPFSDRQEIVSSLKCVDEVVTQHSRDKLKAYFDIKFDIMFVGDDWKGSEIFNNINKELTKHNAYVDYLPYTKKVSSTNFRELLQNLYDAEKLIK
tara:strand:+ start:308 stop:754 length:447 start_codon:yes stop_codon:yes gene_type:complete